MAFATETLIGNRFYAIHQTSPFTGLHARRYWPTNYTSSALWPLIVAEPAQLLNVSAASPNLQNITRLWNCVLILGEYTEGVPSESIQTLGETWLYQLRVNYAVLRRLDLNKTALDGVVQTIAVQPDQGIVPFQYNAALASITLPISVTFCQSLL